MKAFQKAKHFFSKNRSMHIWIAYRSTLRVGDSWLYRVQKIKFSFIQFSNKIHSYDQYIRATYYNQIGVDTKSNQSNIKTENIFKDRMSTRTKNPRHLEESKIVKTVVAVYHPPEIKTGLKASYCAKFIALQQYITFHI